MTDFLNKHALVVGGASGIGAATAQLLALQGAHVHVLDSQPLSYQQERVAYMACDVAQADALKQAIQTLIQHHGRIDLCFFNAGVLVSEIIEETTAQALDDIVDINFKACFYTMQAVLPVMKKQNYGRVVLMGSDQTLIAKTRNAAYGMTKAAVGGLTKAAALECAGYDIRVNCVCPGTVDTPFLQQAVQRSAQREGITVDSVLAELAQEQIIQRIAQPEEVANVVLFLLSEQSSYITGVLLPVDGGYTAV